MSCGFEGRGLEGQNGCELRSIMGGLSRCWSSGFEGNLKQQTKTPKPTNLQFGSVWDEDSGRGLVSSLIELGSST